MKISSKSLLLSPARAGATRDPPPISLSTSLSRSRLRNSRSIKGGASPVMFPTTGKKKGSGFENPEPSSPKVTCIGQVRVKSRKKKKKHPQNLRSLSRRRSSGEGSFRRLEYPGNNGFGSHGHGQSQSQNLGSNYQECVPMQRNNQRWVHLPLTICESLRAFGSEVSCLFPCRSSCSSTAALPEGGGGREVEVEVVAGVDDVDDEIDEMGIGNLRRHVFQDLEIVNDSVLGSVDEGRVSTCVPPKNALLLMRCRSDPMKMEALTNRFWEPSMEKNEEEDEDEESFHIEEQIEERKIPENLQEHDDFQENAIHQEKVEKNLEVEMENKVQEEKVETNQEMERKPSVEEEEEEEEEEESMFLWSLFKEQDQEFQEIEEEEEESMYLWSLFEDQDQEFKETEEEEEVHSEMEDALEELYEDVEESMKEEVKIFEKESKSLPECLLLMMYEPKLSMEVSKETWVCSKDFIRHHSGRKPPPVPPPVKSTAGQGESNRQPARSSCSYPAPMATKFDQKLVNTHGFEPLVLKRCKSEPMRATLAPETCYWENKLSPPRRASFGLRF